MRLAAAITVGLGAAGAAHADNDYFKQFGLGDLPVQLAAMMETNGCTMTESDMIDFLLERGAGTSGAQATITDLAEAKALKWDGAERYTLRGWGRCS